MQPHFGGEWKTNIDRDGWYFCSRIPLRVYFPFLKLRKKIEINFESLWHFFPPTSRGNLPSWSFKINNRRRQKRWRKKFISRFVWSWIFEETMQGEQISRRSRSNLSLDEEKKYLVLLIAPPSLIYRRGGYLARKEFRSITKCRRPPWFTLTCA